MLFGHAARRPGGDRDAPDGAQPERWQDDGVRRAGCGCVRPDTAAKLPAGRPQAGVRLPAPLIRRQLILPDRGIPVV